MVQKLIQSFCLHLRNVVYISSSEKQSTRAPQDSGRIPSRCCTGTGPDQTIKRKSRRDGIWRSTKRDGTGQSNVFPSPAKYTGYTELPHIFYHASQISDIFKLHIGVKPRGKQRIWKILNLEKSRQNPSKSQNAPAMISSKSSNSELKFLSYVGRAIL